MSTKKTIDTADAPLKDFFYQIKGKKSMDQKANAHDIWDSNWVWPPIFSGKVSAVNRKAAIELVHEEFGVKFPTRVLAKDLEAANFLLSVKEITPEDVRLTAMFVQRTCKQCNEPFRNVDKLNFDGEGGSWDFCSNACNNEHREVAYQKRRNEYFENSDYGGMHPPVIYRITNHITNKVYIGKTTQAFTLRWYQHFFQSKSGSTLFHQAIREYPLCNWRFEIIELVKIPDTCKTQEDIRKYILERESHYINEHDSINNGYNSVISMLGGGEEEIPSMPETGTLFNNTPHERSESTTSPN